MKLAILITNINSQGGVSRVVSNLANEFIKNEGIEIEIISVFKYEQELQYQLNKKIKLLYMDMDIDLNVNKIKKQIIFAKEVNKVINNANYDVVLSTSAFLNMYCILFKNKNNKMKIIGSEHGAYSHLNWVWRKMTKIIYKRLDAFVLLTSSEKQIYEKFTPNINVIPNMVTFDSKSKATLTNKNIISVGRLDENKNILNLIDVFKIVNQRDPQSTLTICGSGEKEYTDMVINKINESCLKEKIIIKEFTENIELEFLNSSIFVMTSKSEGLPMVMIEAISLGLPCVSYDIKTGPSDIIKNGENGYLIKPFETEVMANYINELIENNKKRHLFGENAYKISEKFSKKKVVKKWIDLFYKVRGENID